MNNVINMGFDRILVLKRMEGKSSLTQSGVVDNGLFTGKNKLHAVRDDMSLWGLKYEHGELPQSLKQSFTTWQKMYDFVKAYYERRNIEIAEVINA